MYRCKDCRRTFNERSDTPFNFIEVATDGLASYPRAIKEELGEETEHEVRPCTANPVEQSHRRIKHRYYPTLGFGEFDAAQRLCRAVDEVGNFIKAAISNDRICMSG